MNAALHSLLLDVRSAMAMYLVLVTLVSFTVAFGALRRAASHRDRRRARTRGMRAADSVRLQHTRLAAEAMESARCAEELAVAASRSGVTAAREEEEWRAMQRAAEAARRAYEEADRAARRLVRASAFEVPLGPVSRDELAERTRHLHREANRAYRRGELSMAELCSVLAHRDGWDPSLHPFQNDLALRLAGRERRWHEYQAVCDLERAARHRAEVAAAAKCRLDAEAFAAAAGALRARSRLMAETSGRRGRPAALAAALARS